MTFDEYHAALTSLTPEQFAAFRAAWGGSADTVDGSVSQFVYAPSADAQKWDQIAVFHLRNGGVAQVRTEAEKSMEAAVKTADAAQASAHAAERSATSAANSSRAAWWSQVVALLAIIVSLAVSRC